MCPDPASLQSFGELLAVPHDPRALLLPQLGRDATGHHHHLHMGHSGRGAGGRGRQRGGEGHGRDRRGEGGMEEWRGGEGAGGGTRGIVLVIQGTPLLHTSDQLVAYTDSTIPHHMTCSLYQR